MLNNETNITLFYILKKYCYLTKIKLRKYILQVLINSLNSFTGSNKIIKPQFVWLGLKFSAIQ